MNYVSQQIYYKDSLHVEDVNLSELDLQTPYYCYTYQGIIDNYRKISNLIPNTLICYAVKANPNISIIKMLAKQGAGADVVSEGEMRRALAGGMTKIIFSGVGKTAGEIEFALKNNVYQINVESISELKLVKEIGNKLGMNTPIGIRVNLDVEGETHDKISTCRKKDKFGIPVEDLSSAIDEDVIGLSIHIGSQISNLDVFKRAFLKLKNILNGLPISNIKRIDLGGGLCIPYREGDAEFDYSQYYQLVNELFSDYQTLIEPGRALVGNAGILISKVLFVKRNGNNIHVVIDAGMNDLMRPTIYNAYHQIIPINSIGKKKEVVDVVGPVCETADTFAKQREMPVLKEGDLVAICTAGAYGASMTSSYNSRLLIPEVMIKGKDDFIIRPRGTYNDLIDKELSTSFQF